MDAPEIATEEIGFLVEAARRILAGGSDAGDLAAELCDAGVGDLAGDWALTAAMFTAQGETVGRSTVLDLLLAGSHYRDGVRVVLPLPGSQDPPGSPGPTIAVRGIVLSAAGAERFVVHTGSQAGLIPANRLSVELVDGLDPVLGIGVVSAAVKEDDFEPTAGPDWQAIVQLGRHALAYELVGVGQRALDIAVQHVTTRNQFGAPLAALQSVRHRLVEVHVMLEAARDLLAATRADPDAELTAMVVKAAAGQGALAAVAAAQQVCGAMGFTAEYGLHVAVRRVYVLDALLCGTTELEWQIGALLATRATLAPLAVL
jgi:hypothetical protein